ncbi:MAG TPA: cation:proton antiporter [Bryobacteraceae bacterium]|nr:cation:proton antiporter [Bryobacteraceae bacterium]
MNELAAIGLILLLALLAGHLVKFARIPEVTGYILAGVAVGPSGYGWISHHNLQALEVFSQVALGLILFSIGSVFEWQRVRSFGASVGTVTLIESAMAGTLVFAGMLLIGQPWPVSLLLGAIAIETAAASTLMVMRECNSSGPLSETLTGLIAINNIVCLIAFSVAASLVELSLRTPATFLEALSVAVWPLLWQMIGSLCLGYLIGLLLAAWASQVHEHGEILILLTGCVLLAVGVSNALGLSPLISSLAVGATMVNLSARSKALFAALSRTDPPLYAIFFVIAGADLNLALLPTLGVSGVIYAIGRATGKLVGARIGGRWMGFDPVVQKLLGPSMLSQAGLAIGLVLVTSDRFPSLAGTVATVVLAAVAIFELVGPVAARWSLSRAGEVRPSVGEPAL